MANPHADKIFPKDVLKRAKEYLAAIPGGTGAYTSSQGAPICREHVALGITHRDHGIKSDPGNIFMSDGASQVGALNSYITCHVLQPDTLHRRGFKGHGWSACPGKTDKTPFRGCIFLQMACCVSSIRPAMLRVVSHILLGRFSSCS